MSSSKSQPTVTSLEGLHEVRLGRSFQMLNDNSPHNQSAATFHTFRYDFKPASIDLESAGQVVIGEQGEHHVSVTLPHVAESHSSSTYFNGNQRAVDKECVLIVDKQTGKMTLELIYSTVNLKRVRDEPREVAAPPQASLTPNPVPPVAPPPAVVTKQQLPELSSKNNMSNNIRSAKLPNPASQAPAAATMKRSFMPTSASLGLNLSEDDEEETIAKHTKAFGKSKPPQKSPSSDSLSSSSEEEIPKYVPSKVKPSVNLVSRMAGPGTRPYFTEESQHTPNVRDNNSGDSSMSLSDESSDSGSSYEEVEDPKQTNANYYNKHAASSGRTPEKANQNGNAYNANYHYNLASATDLLQNDLMLSDEDDDDDL